MQVCCFGHWKEDQQTQLGCCPDALGKDQPEMFTFADRHGRPIGDSEAPSAPEDFGTADDVESPGVDPAINDNVEIPGVDRNPGRPN
jgi:hypothetical protein